MKYSMVLILLGIGSIVGFLFVFGVDLQWVDLNKMESVDVNINTLNSLLKQGVEKYKKRRIVLKSNSNIEKNDDNSDFYQVIVDNNLFRPLGWKLPNEEPEYTLIGTAIDAIGTNSEAYVVGRRSNQFYVVSVGDEIGDAVVVEIEGKQITLYEHGEMITLNTGSMEFLNTGDSPSHTDSSPQYHTNNQRRTSTKSTDIEREKKRTAKFMKKSEKQINAAMKEVSKMEKDLKKAENKILKKRKK